MLMRCSKRPRTAGQKSSGRGKFTRTALVFGERKSFRKDETRNLLSPSFLSTLGCFKNPLKSVSRKSGGEPCCVGIGNWVRLWRETMALFPC